MKKIILAAAAVVVIALRPDQGLGKDNADA
jgi:hypothetical protein